MLTWFRRIVLAALALVVPTLASGVAYEQWARRMAMRRYPPAGALVEVNGKRTHLHCSGEGEPTVVLESGWSASGSLDWALVQPAISRLTRACSYDRAGIMWSEGRRGPRDGTRIAAELHALLNAASESPPYVMVGHSLGGPLGRVFDAQFKGEVVGFVFVDSSHPDQYDRLPSDGLETLANHGSPFVARILAATGIYRLRASLPNYGLPAETRSVVEHFLPTSAAAVAGEAAAADGILEQAGRAGNLGDRPLVVLTAANHGRTGMSPAAIISFQSSWVAPQDELAALSSNSVRRTVEHAHHYIQLTDPEAVVEAVRDVVTAVREGRILATVPRTGSRDHPSGTEG